MNISSSISIIQKYLSHNPLNIIKTQINVNTISMLSSNWRGAQENVFKFLLLVHIIDILALESVLSKVCSRSHSPDYWHSYIHTCRLKTTSAHKCPRAAAASVAGLWCQSQSHVDNDNTNLPGKTGRHSSTNLKHKVVFGGPHWQFQPVSWG